nr:cation:proton antiporter [Halegenticoccus tardaugens]
MAVEAGWLLTFLAGMTLVLAVAHTLGMVADRLGFAPVVGELLTGLVLGPSLFGFVAPNVTSIVDSCIQLPHLGSHESRE